MTSSAIETLKTQDIATKDELTALHPALGRGYASVQVKERNDLAYVELTPSGRRPIDLSTVPPGKVVHLDVHVQDRVDTVKLVGLRTGCVVALTLVDRPSSQHVKTLELHDCSGQVRVVSTMRGVHLVRTTSDVAVMAGDAEHTPGVETPGPGEDADSEDRQMPSREPGSVVLLKDVELTVAEPLVDAPLLLDGGTALLQDRVDRVFVVSAGELDDLGGSSGNRVEKLTIAGNASLTLGPLLATRSRRTLSGCRGIRRTYPDS